MTDSEFNREVGFDYSSDLVFFWIIEPIRRLGINHKDVAFYAGIDPSNFSRIINFKTSPTLSTFGRIISAIKHFSTPN